LGVLKIFFFISGQNSDLNSFCAVSCSHLWYAVPAVLIAGNRID